MVVSILGISFAAFINYPVDGLIFAAGIGLVSSVAYLVRHDFQIFNN